MTSGIGTVTAALSVPFCSLTSNGPPELATTSVTIYVTAAYTNGAFGDILSYSANLRGYELSIGNLAAGSVFRGEFGPVVSALFAGAYYIGTINTVADLQTVFASGSTGRKRSLLGSSSMDFHEAAASTRHLLQTADQSLGCLMSAYLCNQVNNYAPQVLCAPIITTAAIVCEGIIVASGGTAIFTPAGAACLAAILIELECNFAANLAAGKILDCASLQNSGRLPFCGAPPGMVSPGGYPPGYILPPQPSSCSLSSASGSCNDYCGQYYDSVFASGLDAGCCCIFESTCDVCGCAPDACCGFEQSCLPPLVG